MSAVWQASSDDFDNYRDLRIHSDDCDDSVQENPSYFDEQQVARNQVSSTAIEPTECRTRWQEAPGFQVGIYGWRKRCLYLLIMCLLVVVIINLALTLWVLKVMEFSSDGMGNLRIFSGGIQLNGQAAVLDSLIASSIRSRKGQPITIDSSRNLTITARHADGSMASRMTLSREKLEHVSGAFYVKDTKGKTLFSANRHEVVVGADVLKVTGAGGAVFGGTVQVPLVKAATGSNLRLESPTRSLEVKGSQGIAIESRAGDIFATCLNDLKLKSLAGAIRLESEHVYFRNLRTASVTEKGDKRLPRNHQTPQYTGDVFQLCACKDGRLFLASPQGICATKENDYICR